MSSIRILTLAVLWCVLTGDASALNAGAGTLLAAVLVGATRKSGAAPAARAPRGRASEALGRRLIARPLRALALLALFLFELCRSNLRVARLVLGPFGKLEPRILEVPVDCQSEEELALLSDLITLTPGTLTLDVADDGRTLLVHVLEVQDPEAVRRAIQSGLGARVRRLYE